jgi:septum formation protein
LAGIDFSVCHVDVDERIVEGEAAASYVARLARAKALAVECRISGTVVLAADTAVVIDGEVLGKPADDRDAARMLSLLSGRSHEVLTGIALRVPSEEEDRVFGEVVRTLVRFSHLSADDIAQYVATGESRGKAGAYAIQGFASRFADDIQGSYTNVVGLPIGAVWRRLREVGFGV